MGKLADVRWRLFVAASPESIRVNVCLIFCCDALWFFSVVAWRVVLHPAEGADVQAFIRGLPGYPLQQGSVQGVRAPV